LSGSEALEQLVDSGLTMEGPETMVREMDEPRLIE
jgi:hypothetical protein